MSIPSDKKASSRLFVPGKVSDAGNCPWTRIINGGKVND